MLLFFLFICGLFIGSFLNVLIDRLPRGETVVKGKSRCESCKHKLAWYDLIPILSFVELRGKCRYCGALLSWYYPLVEVITGGLFVLTFHYLQQSNLPFTIYHLPFIFQLAYFLFLISSLVVIFFTDLKYGIIPDKVVYPAVFVSLFYLFIIHNSLFIIHILSAFGAFAFFFLLFAITRGRGMGFGDVKLAFLLGLFLGFPKIVIGLYIAFLTGAVVSLILVVWGKKKLKGSTIPFGPFLVFGTIVAHFLGNVFLRMVLPWLS